MTTTSEPSWAERARTALADARLGTLVIRNCRSATTATSVSVDVEPDGRPLVWLDQSTPAVSSLTTCAVATLVTPGPSPGSSLHLVGFYEPVVRETSRRGYRASLLSVQVTGPTRVVIPIDDFRQAAPDPLHRQAPQVLRHLDQAHADDLLACVRAHGIADARMVAAQALDRYALQLAVVDDHGVRRLRLPFPDGPIDSLDDLPAGFRMPLSCRCTATGQG